MGATESKAASANVAKKYVEPHKQNKVKVVDGGDPPLYYVTPATIGVGIRYGKLAKLIPRNTAIPTPKKFKMVFSTVADDQKVMTFKVYLGERSKARDNKLLCQLEFPHIPPAPKGAEQVTLSLGINAKGNMNVSVEHKPTKRKLMLVVKGVGVKGKVVTEEEVEEMVREGERNKLVDEEHVNRAAAVSAMVAYACTMTTSSSVEEEEDNGEEDVKKLIPVADLKKVNDIMNNVVMKMMDEFKEKVKQLGH